MFSGNGYGGSRFLQFRSLGSDILVVNRMKIAWRR